MEERPDAGMGAGLRMVIALDGSPSSDAAISMVATSFHSTNATVRLLHVVEPFPVKLAETEGSDEHPDFDRARAEQRLEAERLLTKAADTLHAAGFVATSTIREGDPATVILEEAAAWSADLIVVGSRGRKGLQRLLLGSVSEAVARGAACSVTIVRLPRARGIREFSTCEGKQH